jgi:hypothetical protein
MTNSFGGGTAEVGKGLIVTTGLCARVTDSFYEWWNAGGGTRPSVMSDPPTETSPE